MQLFSNSVALATVLFATLSQAQILINEQSFGHSGRLSVVDGRIPHFTISGYPREPEILSNKVILTPLAPGNQRSSIWADSPLTRTTWVADVDFRATGAERAGGNLNIWLARRGKDEVGAQSAYTVRKFDGLVLMVDSHGGSGGMIRGFLSDGNVDFASHTNVDKLAFGQCDYYYRNLGRPSQIKLRQTISNFRVEVDGNLCFETDKVSLPAGYHFGITAATPENPDSFEIFKFVVMSDSTLSSEGSQEQNKRDETHHGQQQQQQQQQHEGGKPNEFADAIPDQSPDIFHSSKEQFEDLHNRLQSATHHVSAVYNAVAKHHQMDEQRFNEMMKAIESLHQELGPLHQINDIQTRLRNIEGEFRSMHQDMRKKLTAHGDTLQENLRSHHHSLARAMSDSVPGHGKLMFFFVGTQLFLIVGYVVYKRHRASSPKKYL
ncbi:hypothetical protein E4U31_004127 [Claviceps sp. LM219 group G6]|nr:hypothetical protein E4U31_004127 [Claviceps sp. LM219 group G6]KAG6122873.1 hypothetical protein E4U14_003747 [Claviceps sp. LM454 group G7]